MRTPATVKAIGDVQAGDLVELLGKLLTERGCMIAVESGKSITIQWEDGERVCYSVDDDASTTFDSSRVVTP
jgi:predicted transcriptional regulator of viral defense system